MKSGLSLLEIVVALGLLSLLTLMTVNLSRPLALISARTMDRMEMRQQALISLGQLRSSMQASAPQALSLRDGIIGVNPRAQPAVDSSGNLLWSKKISLFYRLPADSTLRRREWPPDLPQAGDPPVPTWMSSAARPKRLEGPELLALINPDAPSNQLAKGVVEWKVENLGSDGLIHQPIQVLLILERRERRLEFRRSLFLLGSS